MKKILLIVSLFISTNALAADPGAVVPDAPILPPVTQAEAPATPAGGYFPILPMQADSDAPAQLLPVASNHPLEGRHDKITRAVIALHDVTRDATSVVAMLTAIAGPHNATTMIVGPQFMMASDIARYKGHLPGGLAFWPMGKWVDGGKSSATPPAMKGVSSFTAVDLLLLFLADKTIFPDLKDIVIAGHGEGADFVMRYAAVGQAQDVIDPQKTSLRYVAANASSYLYFTTLRPVPGKTGFSLPDAKACPNYNDYKYGLAHLNPYSQRLGSDEIRLRYPARRVTILAGAKTEKSYADTNCAAALQGPDRYARASNYQIYLSTIFSDAVEQTQVFAPVRDAGFDALAMFDSPCGMSSLFGDGNCAPAPVTGAGP